MEIHAHIVTYNEEKLLPFTLDYYSKICSKIYIHDNMSDDSSDEIFKQYDKVIVKKWSSSDTFDEMSLINKRNEEYKITSRDADWVIVCDCDEFLYHPNLIEKLIEYKNDGVTVPNILGYVMVSDKFPTYDGELITDKIKIGWGVDIGGSKNIIFDPKIDMKFGPGSHTFSSNNTIKSKDSELKILHYRLLGKEYVDETYSLRLKRLSDDTISKGWNTHYNDSKIKHVFIDKTLKDNKNVI